MTSNAPLADNHAAFNARQEGPIVFFLTPHVSLFSVLAIYEVFRAVNRLTGRPIYNLQFASIDGHQVECSNGMTVQPHCRISDVNRPLMLAVAASYEPPEGIRRKLLSAVRRAGRHSTLLCGIDLGVMLLAEAGLLNGYAASVHWETLQSMRERFPNVSFRESAFTVDKHIMTCGGHVAGVDLALSLVSNQHGHELALAAERELLYTRPRDGSSVVVNLLDPLSQNQTVKKMHDIMERQIEDPVQISNIARQMGVSRRQMEQLTKRFLGLSPHRYYLRLRLNRSREMLMYSNIPIGEISVLTGFESASAFSRAFRVEFLSTPREFRTRYRIAYERLPGSPRKIEQ